MDKGQGRLMVRRGQATDSGRHHVITTHDGGRRPRHVSDPQPEGWGLVGWRPPIPCRRKTDGQAS